MVGELLINSSSLIIFGNKLTSETLLLIAEVVTIVIEWDKTFCVRGLRASSNSSQRPLSYNYCRTFCSYFMLFISQRLWLHGLFLALPSPRQEALPTLTNKPYLLIATIPTAKSPRGYRRYTRSRKGRCGDCGIKVQIAFESNLASKGRLIERSRCYVVSI